MSRFSYIILQCDLDAVGPVRIVANKGVYLFAIVFDHQRYLLKTRVAGCRLILIIGVIPGYTYYKVTDTAIDDCTATVDAPDSVTDGDASARDFEIGSGRVITLVLDKFQLAASQAFGNGPLISTDESRGGSGHEAEKRDANCPYKAYSYQHFNQSKPLGVAFKGSPYEATQCYLLHFSHIA